MDPSLEGTFADKYEVGTTIGRGIGVVTKTCANRQTNQLHAVRIVCLSKFSPRLRQKLLKNLKREEEISLELKHSLVAPVLEVYCNESLYYMIQDYMEGADLCLEIVNRAISGFVYSEAVASHYMKQILEALRYCHSKNILHRDLGIHSISLSSGDNHSPVKLGGFACAVAVEELENTSEYALDYETRWMSQPLITVEKDKFGYLCAPSFLSAEMLRGEIYGKPSDVWSAGCLLYLLLSGTPPFLGSPARRERAVLDAAYVLHGKQWDEVSEEAKGLIRKMLEPNPNWRMTIDEALQDSWIKDRSKVPKMHLIETVRALHKFNQFRGIKDTVVSTALDPHWSRQSNPATPTFSSMTIGADSPAAELGGTWAILECLEDIEAMEFCDNIPRETSVEILNDTQLNSFLYMFDVIHNRMRALGSSYPQDSLGQQINEVLEHLANRCRNSVNEVRAFYDLVTLPTFQALVQSQDLIARKVNENAAIRLADCHDQSGASMLTINGNGTFSRQTLTNNQHQQFTQKQQQQQSFLSSQSTLTYQQQSSSSNNNNGSSDNLAVTEVKVVHFQKNTNEPLGISLKVREDKKCVVSRILDGGMIHRQGTLQVGDEIREINGRRIEGETVQTLQDLLRGCTGNVAFKVVKSHRAPPILSKVFVKALFSYDPATDDFIPSREAGLKFRAGDILKIVSKEDPNWWQARPWDAPRNSPAGLVPSPQLQEVRISVQDQMRKKNAHSSWLNKKKQGHKDKYLVKNNSLFDQLELVTYEEVVQVPEFPRKTLVLLGAHGVGRRHIKNMFVTNHPQKYAYPIPHTTRKPRPDEEHGRNYFFVTEEQMMSEMKDNQFLEYGTHEGALYGTKLETIRQIHRQGLIAILDIEPQALKILRTHEYAPFVVFIAAPSNIALMDDASLQRLSKESELLERTYQHFFDLKVVNNEIEETIEKLERAMENATTNHQWIPVSWIY